MRRILLGPAALFCLLAASRDGYHAAYQSWRQADPNLERDAGAGRLGERANKVALLAAKYGAERSAYLRESADEQERGLAWLDAPAFELADAGAVARDNVASAQTVVKKNLDSFANDPDPAIQRLKATLDKENAALSSLANAVAERQSAGEAAQSAVAAANAARTNALNAGRDLSGALKAAADESDREAALWAEYYRKLAEPSRTETLPAATPSAPAPVRTAGMPLPLARYTGAWVFPSGGLYHGPQPEFIDLVVHEQNGRADGTLFARFRVPAGSKDDPVLRFDFSGEFKPTRNQTFALETSDGAKGTLELIPGPAFNLLEINFQAEPRAGKVRQANVVLVKK